MDLRIKRRMQKKYKASDFIRGELEKLGIRIEDTKDGIIALPVGLKLDDKKMVEQLGRLLTQAQSME